MLNSTLDHLLEVMVTGCDFRICDDARKSAIRIVNKMFVNVCPESRFPRNNKLAPSEIDAGKNIGKIQAIKMVRERTSCGLAEAKNLVEDEFQKHGWKFYNGSN